MAAREKTRPFRKSKKVTDLSRRLGDAAAGCVLHVMVNDRGGLSRDSAVFLMLLKRIWKAREIDADLVWDELDARISLADDLREQGIRPQKGGRFRSTKLP